MINWKVRFKNPIFLTQLILSILTPMLAYAGLNMNDITSWSILGQLILEAIHNPYVLSLVIVSIWNALNDPTTTGFSDSEIAMTYKEPNGRK